MCTLTVALRRHPDFPLLLAANRDEQQDRPASPPRVWPGELPFVAGRDDQAGGTWLGVNAAGLAIGLTNHWCGRPNDPSKESRGRVVTELLRYPTLGAVRDRLARLDPRSTNPYLLLAADLHGEAFHASSEDGLRPHSIGVGVFSLGNRPPDPADPRPAAARVAIEEVLGARHESATALRLGLQGALATHVGDRGPASSPCVHTERGFGTVSATVVLGSFDAPAYWHAPGPPCVTRFEDRTEAWASILRGPEL